MIERFGVYLAPFDPTVGAEMGKIRPCVVLSPDEMNRTVRTVLIAPLTSTQRRYPFRVPCKFEGKDGHIALDQMRAFDRLRLKKHLGNLDAATAARVLRKIHEIFR